MKNFKSYLLEYLTDGQRDRYKDVHMTDKARADTDHFFGVGNDKIRGEIRHDDKSEIHKQLESHLGRDLSHDEYKSGATKDKYGRDVKIGRLIKDRDLRNQFDQDPSRKIPVGGTKTSTVRGVEVAGQTNSTPDAQHPKGHSWGDISCKNVDTGINKRYLKSEIRQGTVVHFVHDHNGQEIYRATLQPHHNDGGHVAYAVDAEYGVKHPKFTEDAHRVAKELSGKFRTGVYRKDPDVYNDSGQREMSHPNATVDDITHILKHGTENDKDSVVNHPLVNADHITHIMKHEASPGLRAKALHNRSATSEHIMMGLNDPQSHVRRAAIASHPLTAEHISRAIQKDQPVEVRRGAMLDVSATPAHITKVIKHDPDVDVVRQALMHPASEASHITMALKRSEPDIRRAAIKSSEVNSDHIGMAVKDSDDRIVSYAVRHKQALPEHISHVLKHGSRNAIEYALAKDSNAQPEHLGSIINSTDPKTDSTTKYMAALHPNASAKNISDALKLKDPDINHDLAWEKPHLTKEHLDHLVRDSNPDIMRALSRRQDLGHEHISHLLQHGDSSIQRRLAQHPNLAPEHMMHMLDHEPSQVTRSYIFDNSDVPHHVLSHAIHNDPSDMVRTQAIGHKNTHPDDLVHVAKHNEDAFDVATAMHHPNMPSVGLQHIVDRYKKAPLGQQAALLLRNRSQ